MSEVFSSFDFKLGDCFSREFRLVWARIDGGQKWAVVGVNDGVGEVAFGGLELQDFFLDRIAGDEEVGEDLVVLIVAVRAVDRSNGDAHV